MDGMLSQDEINALLSGMDTTAGGEGDAPAAEAPSDSSDIPVTNGAPAGGDAIDETLLNDSEKDAIGEVANIRQMKLLNTSRNLPHSLEETNNMQFLSS